MLTKIYFLAKTKLLINLQVYKFPALVFTQSPRPFKRKVEKMALETLKDVKEIDGFKVVREKLDNMSWDEFDKLRNDYPINITDSMNCISFKIQNGPIKENGINGCQVDTIIAAAKLIIEGLNKKIACRENAMVITKLDEALMWSKKRKEDREKRGVEGFNKA